MWNSEENPVKGGWSLNMLHLKQETYNQWWATWSHNSISLYDLWSMKYEEIDNIADLPWIFTNTWFRDMMWNSLLRLEVPVDDAEAVQMVQGQGQLRQVELDVFFCEHHLQHGDNRSQVRQAWREKDNTKPTSLDLRDKSNHSHRQILMKLTRLMRKQISQNNKESYLKLW